jgi:hypothetical protein
MEDKTLITVEYVREKLLKVNLKEKENCPLLESVMPISPYIEAAAVMAFFDPDTILPIVQDTPPQGTEKERMLCELIGCSEVLSDLAGPESNATPNPINPFNSKLVFTLKDAVRKETLSRLVKENKLQKAINANRKEIDRSKRPLQEMLTSCLMMTPPNLNEVDRERLDALYKISLWLDGIEDMTTFSTSEIAGRIELLEMLSPFRHLTGTYENGKFIEKFRGRHSELASLRSYVGVAPPKGIKESVQRFISSVFSPGESKPLVVFGIGGIGKSSLISKFILEHVEAGVSGRFPFVYLDFDRPQLSALEPETLLIEAARQLSIQYRDDHEISSGFLEFYTKWLRAYSSLIEGSSSSSVNVGTVSFISKKKDQRAGLQFDFLSLINKLTSRESKPFLMVLDTFEEVQIKGVEFVNEVLDFLETFKKHARLRVIISGRAPLDKDRTREMELGTLDRQAAEGYLSSLGIDDSSTAKIIVSKIGGNPLTLKLAAQLVKEYGISELTVISSKDSVFFFSISLPEIEVQAILYNRILSHIRNQEVRKLAHPGLILRRITPELIQLVLAEPCGLHIENLKGAEDLFRELSKEVGLVTYSEPGVLKHRSDVRKVMLKLIMESTKSLQALSIHRLAVGYYTEREGIINRAEEFYHRLALGESPRALDPRWIEGMEDYLAGSLDELPENGRAFILGKAGLESIDRSVWESADLEDQMRYLAKQAANLLNSGLPQRALQLLGNILPSNLVLTLIKVRALRQIEKHSDAAYLARQALNSFYVENIPLEIKTELQKYAMWEDNEAKIPSNEKNVGLKRITGSSRSSEDNDEADMTTLDI